MAGGPGGHEAERLSVKVVPDTSGFKEKLKAELAGADDDIKIKAEVDVDDADAKAKLEALGRDLEVELKVRLQTSIARMELDEFKADAGGIDMEIQLQTLFAREKLEQLRNSIRDVVLDVDVDTTYAKAALAALTRKRTVIVEVELAATLARAKLATVLRDVKAHVDVELELQKARIELAVFLRPRRLTVHVDVDRDALRPLRLHMAQIFQLAQGVGRQIQNVGQTAQGAFNQATRSASSFGGMIRPIYLVALPFLVAAIYLLIGAIAGLVIIIGAAVGGLLLMVAPIAAIGAGVAYILKSSDKQAKKLREQFKGVGKTAQGVLRTAVQPMTKAIQKQIPFVQRWVRSLKGPLKNAFAGASQYVDDLSLGLTNFVNNALDGTVKALQSPGLSAAFSGFQQFIADIGTAIGLFFLTLSEGGANYRDMFNALGTAFIDMAPPLARMLNAFAGVSPGLIGSLADNLNELFALLSDPQVLAALSSLASFSFDAVVWGLRLIAWQIIYTVGLWRGMWAAAQWIWHALGALISSVWAHVKSTTLTAVETIRSTVSSKWNGMISFLRGLLNGFTGWFGSFWARITGQSSRGALSTRAAAVGPFSGMASAIAGIMSSIVGIVESAWNRISGIVSSIAGAVGRARSLVGGLGGLLDKVNPFSLPASGPSLMTALAGPTTMSLLSAPSEPVYTLRSDSIYDDVDSMRATSRSLRQQFLKARKGDSASSSDRGESLARRVFNFTTYAAPNVPTEKQFVKWLDYADTLYAE